MGTRQKGGNETIAMSRDETAAPLRGQQEDDGWENIASVEGFGVASNGRWQLGYLTPVTCCRRAFV